MEQFTVVKDRKIWVDGDVTITSKQVLYDMILAGIPISEFYVDEIDKEVKLYNANNEGKELKVKNSVNPLSTKWTTPSEYELIDIPKYILRKLYDEVEANNFSEDDTKIRLDRVLFELKLWEKHNLIPLLRNLLFIIATFTKNDIVWGTGRGSSCACYILYLIGLHNVDSIVYELDIKEFFKE